MIILRNSRNFKQKQELLSFECKLDKFSLVKLTITEAKELYVELGKRIMYAESNELISTFLRSNGMDEAQIETAITQLNKIREKL